MTDLDNFMEWDYKDKQRTEDMSICAVLGTLAIPTDEEWKVMKELTKKLDEGYKKYKYDNSIN